MILSSFYWGYAITHLPAGIPVKKFGPKIVIGLSVFLTSLLTIATPALTNFGGAKALIVSRVLMGGMHGLIQPSISGLLSQWIPPQERSMVGAVVYPGTSLGTLVSTAMAGLILGKTYSGWPAIFYLFGGISLIWVLLWMFLCYNNPKKHPFISNAEKVFLEETLSTHTHANPPPIPWKYIFKRM